MCRGINHGGRRCPSATDAKKIAERNAVRRETAARVKGQKLSNAQYTHRVTYAYEAVAQQVADGKETHKLYARETSEGILIWNEERTAQHDIILQEAFKRWENVPNDGKAIMTGGLGGAGKSTVLAGHAGVDLTQYATLNPDDVKEIMAEKGMIPQIPGLSAMESSPLVHEEASHIAALMGRHLTKQRKNIIYDITMTSYKSTLKKIEGLKDSGYDVEAVFVDIPAEVSVERAEFRHRTGVDELITENKGYGGRLLPLEVAKAQAEANPLQVFTTLREEGHFSSWSAWDNSVFGRSPVKMGGSVAE